MCPASGEVFCPVFTLYPFDELPCHTKRDHPPFRSFEIRCHPRDPAHSNNCISPLLNFSRNSSFPSTAPSIHSFKSLISWNFSHRRSSEASLINFLLSFHHGQWHPLPLAHVFDGLMEFLVLLLMLCSHHRILFRSCHERRPLSFDCYRSSAPFVIAGTPN